MKLKSIKYLPKNLCTTRLLISVKMNLSYFSLLLNVRFCRQWHKFCYPHPFYLYRLQKGILEKNYDCCCYGEIAWIANTDIFQKKYKTKQLMSHTKCSNSHAYWISEEAFWAFYASLSKYVLVRCVNILKCRVLKRIQTSDYSEPWVCWLKSWINID